MRNSLCLIVLSLTFVQCSSIKGFYSGYKQLTELQKKEIVIDSGSICAITNDNKIHVINAAQLKESLKNNSRSLIYSWSPHCHSDVCILISACQDYCDKNDLELYVISDYYSWDVMQGQNVAKRPIFVANHQYYKSDYAIKYNRLFLEELAPGNKLVGKKQYGRFLFFEKDQLVERRDKLF